MRRSFLGISLLELGESLLRLLSLRGEDMVRNLEVYMLIFIGVSGEMGSWLGHCDLDGVMLDSSPSKPDDSRLILISRPRTHGNMGLARHHY